MYDPHPASQLNAQPTMSACIGCAPLVSRSTQNARCLRSSCRNRSNFAPVSTTSQRRSTVRSSDATLASSLRISSVNRPKA